MAPKAKGLAKAKVVVGKDNAQSKAQCKAKAKSAPLDNDHGYGNNLVKDHLHLLKCLKGHKGVEQERMHKGQMNTLKDMLNGVPQMPHTGHYSCDTLSEQTNKKDTTMEVSA